MTEWEEYFMGLVGEGKEGKVIKVKERRKKRGMEKGR